jgi:aminopeptidase
MTLTDPRIVKQAEILVDHSVKIKKGENVIISADFEARPLVLELYKLLIKRGAGEVRLNISDYEFAESFLKNATPSQINSFPQIAMDEMKNVSVYIAIKSSNNLRGLSGIDANKISERSKVTSPITDYRVEKTKWVISEFPTNAQAQEADMSLSDYEDFVFSAINDVDWKKKFKEQKKLAKAVNATKIVRIVGEDTDLTLNIAGRKAINAGGEYNMPDGEVFTSVVEDGANGHIKYTFPAIYMGREFTNVRLEFDKGKVISAKAEKNSSDLNKIIDMDKGARTIGELGIGNNYGIKRFTKNILFDEKIGGTIHLALGKGYKETLSKNISALHWDMIKDLRKNGELYFDGKLVQMNGKWLI